MCFQRLPLKIFISLREDRCAPSISRNQESERYNTTRAVSPLLRPWMRGVGLPNGVDFFSFQDMEGDDQGVNREFPFLS